MSWSVVTFDKNTQPWLKEKIQEYIKRVSIWQPLDFHLLKPQISSSIEQNQKKDFSALNTHKLLMTRPRVVLDLYGKECTSEQLALKVNRWQTLHPHLNFIIGPSYGLSPLWGEGAIEVLSLTKMTLTHEIAQLLFFEQLYRAFCILHRHPYHS